MTTPHRFRRWPATPPLPLAWLIGAVTLLLTVLCGHGAEASPPPAAAAGQGALPLTLVYWIGLRDGADHSDGITFKVEIGEVGKPRTLLASTHHQEQNWRRCTADLSPFRGRRVTIRLLADPGKTAVSDWGAWGDVAIVEGAAAADGPGTGQDPAAKPPIRFADLDQFSTGALVGGQDRSPLAVVSGGVFSGAACRCAGVGRRGFFSHPCWRDEYTGCPVYADFTLDLGNPSAAGIDLAAAAEVFAKTPFAAPRDYAQPPTAVAWDDPTRAAQRGAARRMIADLHAAGARKKARFVIPPGQYRFAAPLLPSLTFTDVADLEIIATDVTFWLEAPGGLKLRNCRNVTVRGLTVDADPVPFTQGVIVGLNSSQNYLVLRIIDGFPMPAPNPPDGVLALPFRADGTMIPHRMDTASGVEALVGRFVKVYLTQGLLLGEPDRSTAPVGAGDVLVLAPRQDVAIASSGCANLTFEGVTLFASSHMGITEVNGDGRNAYRGCRIVRRPETRRFIACNADGFHSYMMGKGPTLDACEISYTGDDCVNVHGFFGMVAGVEDPTHLAVITPMGMNFTQGSPLTFYGRDDLAAGGTARVTAIAPLTGEAELAAALVMQRETGCRSFPEKLLWRVTLDAPVVSQRYGLVDSIAGACGEGFRVRGSYFHDNNGRGVLTEASNGLIEGNRFERTGSSGVLLSPDLYWIEGPMPRGITVRGNRFTECNRQLDSRTAGSHAAASLCTSVYMHGKSLSTATPSSGLVFADNTITRAGAAGIFIANARDCEVRNNTIIEPQFFPSLGNGKDVVGEEIRGGIFLAAVRDIRLAGNTTTGGNPGTQQPIVFGPHVDRPSISVEE